MSTTDKDQVLVETIVAEARRAGLSGCEALVQTTTSRTATWQTAAVSGAVLLGPRTVCRLHIRCFSSEGESSLYSARLDENSAPDKLLRAAISAMRKSHGGVLAPRLDVSTMGLSVLDRRYDRIEDEDREQVVSSNVAGCGSVAGVECGLARYTEAHEQRTFLSTSGVGLQEVGTRYSISVDAHLVSDPSVKVSGEVSSRHFADVASIPLGAELARRVALYVDAAGLPAEDLPVIIEPKLVALIMGAVAPAFDGERVAKGQSFVTGDADQVLGNAKLHVIDDASRPGGLATRGFDGRGVPSMSIPLIREGKGGSLYNGVSGAKSVQSRPTGHERPEEGPWLGNLILRSGNRSRNMMFPEIGRFLMLDALATPELEIDLQTGALVLVVHTFLAEGGKRSQYLGVQRFETDCISLWTAISEIGSDQQRHGQVDGSTWVLSGLPPVR
jgi:predicted Zn-dependent protease